MNAFLKNRQIRKKILFTLFIVLVFRLLAHIPVPGIDVATVRAFLQGNAFFGIFDLFSGGGFQNFSIITLGLAPYINISILIQVLTYMIPSLEELSKEGYYGREKINMYTRLLTVPMALVQSYGIYFLLSGQGIITKLLGIDLIVFIVSLVAGALLMVWIGEVLTEYGIGNGISLLIFISIVSRLPTLLLGLTDLFKTTDLFNLVFFAGSTFLIIMAVVMVNEATRNVPIEYGRRGTKSARVSNFFPIKLNQVGVIPIIFAVSVVLLPSLAGNAIQASTNTVLQSIGVFLVQNFSQEALLYNTLYFLLVVGFTYFYTSIQFDPAKISDDLKKQGGYIPGVRPGMNTTEYLRRIVSRITIGGALFLGVIAISPYLLQQFLGISSNLTVGGTSILIAVSVVLETHRQMSSLTVAKNYNKFID